MAEKKEVSERDKYFYIRSNFVKLYQQAYYNKVYINENDKSIIVEVDDVFEEFTNDDWLPQGNENEDSDNEPEEEEVAESDFDFTDQDIYDSDNDYLYHDVFHLSHKTSGEIYDHRMNPLAGLMVTYPVGEGLLEFCFVDFTEELNTLKSYGSLLRALRKDKTDDDTIKSYTHEERFDFMCNSFMFADELLRKTVYTSMFPPMFIDTNERTTALYAFCITELQKEMLRRIEFVFDEGYYPDELLHLTAHERFALYADIYDIPTHSRRTQEFKITVRMDKTALDCCRLPMDIIIGRLQSHVPTKKKSPLEKALGLEAGKVQLAYHVPKFMAVSFEVSALHEMLELEFTKMLEYGIRLHRCKNCGQYFIIKGNYRAEYCDRVRPGNTQTCQQIAAQKKYEEKLHNDKAISLFRKYYKRYHARLKVGTIKSAAFRLWNYQACEKRDMCQNGEITLDEFEKWLEGSFKNREKK